MKYRIITCLVTKYLHLFVCFCRNERAQVSEVTVTGQQSEFCQLTLVKMLHGFHDDCHIDFCLNLHIEASLAHIAKLIRTVRFLSFELPYIKCESYLLHFVVEVSSAHHIIVRRHIVLVIERRIRQLLHILHDYIHSLSIDIQLASSSFLQCLSSCKEIGGIYNQHALLIFRILQYRLLLVPNGFCHFFVSYLLS